MNQNEYLCTACDQVVDIRLGHTCPQAGPADGTIEDACASTRREANSWTPEYRAELLKKGLAIINRAEPWENEWAYDPAFPDWTAAHHADWRAMRRHDKLCQAAPDMLLALQQIYTWLQAPAIDSPTLAAMQEFASRAIAKAGPQS